MSVAGVECQGDRSILVNPGVVLAIVGDLHFRFRNAKVRGSIPLGSTKPPTTELLA
jgi:hypothetical protein